jgi:hypothetical protein
LEGAGLIATRKVGREKFHHLNPVPIRRIHDRWIRKYAEPVAATQDEAPDGSCPGASLQGNSAMP